MEPQDQQNLCNSVIFHLFENFGKEMPIDFLSLFRKSDSSSRSYRLVPQLHAAVKYNLLLLNFFLVESSGAQSPFILTMKYVICA